MLKRLPSLVAAALFTSGLASSAQAATITAFEELKDTTCSSTDLLSCEDPVRDLFRTRDDGNGIVTVLDTDSILVADHQISDSFGLYDNLGNNVDADVSYTHLLSWLPTTTFSSATLQILAYGIKGTNDIVVADTIDIGDLVKNSGQCCTISTSNFDVSASYLADGQLAITVDKSNNNLSNVFSSRLTVTFDEVAAESVETPVAAPEPGSLVLLGSGMFGLAAWARRRQRAAKVGA